MQKIGIVDKSYTKLLRKLKLTLIQSLKRIEEQRVEAYWQTGELISKHLLESKQYGDELFHRLSADLNIGERALYRSVQFYKAFPILSDRTNLGWMHYRLLLSVTDKNKRDSFQSQAIKHSWNAEELQEQIRLEGLRSKEIEKIKAPAKKLKVTRGKLYTYRLIKPPLEISLTGQADNINPVEGNLLVDCGFSFWRDVSLKGLVNPKEKDIVESISAKIRGGSLPVRQAGANFCGGKTEQGYKLKASDAVRKQIYTYKALVERVTDADTIWAHIDLGFNSWSRQKIRFRGIDAPEVSTKKGQKAKEFVEAAISQAPFVVIKTHYPDKYGRYLSDVFYLAGETNPQKVLQEGIFLNQQLLDLGLAKIIND